VLIVEDEAAVRKVLVRIMLAHGYQVLESSSAETALEVYRLRRDKIRLVISDVAMPGRSGHELVAQLRDDQPRLPIILLSAYDEAGIAQHRAAGPAIVTLQKPLAFDELLRAVRAALDAGGRRPRDAQRER
jgi:DNA-binding NtrC family response regulator